MTWQGSTKHWKFFKYPFTTTVVSGQTNCKNGGVDCSGGDGAWMQNKKLNKVDTILATCLICRSFMWLLRDVRSLDIFWWLWFYLNCGSTNAHRVQSFYCKLNFMAILRHIDRAHDLKLGQKLTAKPTWHIIRGAFFVWCAPIMSWPRIMCSQVRMLKFLKPPREML